jgi:hypothetical protein
MKTKEEKKYWMIVFKERNAILLHRNPNFPQYKTLRKVNSKLLNKLIKTARYRIA